MKILILLSICFGLSAQSVKKSKTGLETADRPSPKEEGKTPVPAKTEQPAKDDSKIQNTSAPVPVGNQSTSYDDSELDKIFYTSYRFLNQPKLENTEKTLNTNLVKAFKNEIILRDSPNCLKYLQDINVSSIRKKLVDKESIWMKKIKKEVGYVQFTDFMYIVKYQNYLALIIYEIDPNRHLTKPSQIEFIMNKEASSKEEE